ncbi:MAG: methionyl-tRNA formyltransferase [Elusimicrobiota bacterium]|nr:methionyl-tRNA formyltransferase [Endomicrobiia bacterium]MDW8165810.1 methionyl-tRNA formyltransferase [Elusimicrobiota bacterium]
MKILFWGSSDFSIPFLEDLINNSKIKIEYVITHPDRPAGRGLKIKSSVVKEFAEKNNLEVLTPLYLIEEDFLKKIFEREIDLSVVVSYGKIIPEEIINFHKLGMLNVHFSLLPKYRGAAPIQWCLIRGETTTGVTVFWLDKGMDTGDIFLQEEEPITIEDDFRTLSERLVKLGKKLLKEAINKILLGEIIKIPQNGIPSYAPLITKKDAIINWSLSSYQIHNLVRALVLWPKASTKIKIDNKIIDIKILQTFPLDKEFNHLDTFTYGTIIDVKKDYILVMCGECTLLKILKVQPENRKPLTIEQFVCGYRVKKFDRFI